MTYLVEVDSVRNYRCKDLKAALEKAKVVAHEMRSGTVTVYQPVRVVTAATIISVKEYKA